MMHVLIVDWYICRVSSLLESLSQFKSGALTEGVPSSLPYINLFRHLLWQSWLPLLLARSSTLEGNFFIFAQINLNELMSLT
jgi:hypothetical protein